MVSFCVTRACRDHGPTVLWYRLHLSNLVSFLCTYRYLDRYEKVHYLGEDVDRGSDDDEESRHRRWSARALHSVPLTYNHHQHNVAGS
jgi:hypothetical protein